jgi:adhesin/invasin
MKKVIFHLVVILSLVLSLQACGTRSGGSDSPGNTDTNTPTDSNPGTDPVTGETLTLGSFTLTADADLIPADGSTAATITLTTFDEDDAILGDVSFTASVSGNATLDGVSPSTNATTGEATFTVTSDTAENVTLTIRAGDISQTLPLHFGAYISLVPETVTASGSTTLTAVLKDGKNQPLPGRVVSFEFGELNNDILDISDTTSGAGLASTTVTDVGNDGGVDTVIASSGKVASDPATVTFLPSITEEDLFLSATPTVQVLNTGDFSTIVATIVDGDGTPVSGRDITFSKAPSTANAVLSSASGTTDNSGQVSITVTNDKAENVTVKATVGSASFSVPLYYGASLVLNADKTQSTADGASPVNLSATVRDASGVAVPSVPVDFRVTAGDEALLSKSRVLTGSDNGRAANTLTNTTVETATVEAMAGLVGPKTADFDFVPGDPATILLSSTPAAPVNLSIYGTASITAKVTDSLGNPVADNTPVSFVTTLGNVSSEVMTSGGTATALFYAQEISGTALVTATAGAANSTYSIAIQPASAGSIIVNDVVPEDRTIHIAGTEGNRLATVRFLVKDVAGNTVDDGTQVLVYLDPTRTGGGEAVSAGEAYADSVVTSTINGIATVTLRSGSVAGTIDVVAAYDPDEETDPALFNDDEISTIARIVMVGGMPDAEHFGLAASTLTLAGGLYTDLPSTITATLGDRFGNVVLDGTQVSFISECGLVGESGGFTATTEQGHATAVFRTTAPMLGEDGNLLDGPDAGPVSIRNGLCRIVAFTQGSESYEDIDGDGVYTEGVDNCVKDLPEPYIDENDNGQYDTGELYEDTNGNNTFDTAADFNLVDGATCQENTVIWTSMNLLMTGNIGPFNLRKQGQLPSDGLDFTLGIGGSQTFVVDFQDEYIQDLNGNGILDIGIDYGNAPVAGTTLSVTKDGSTGKLAGTTAHTQPDTTGTGGSYSFTLFSDIDDSAEPALVEISVTVGASDRMLVDGVTGEETNNNNGATVIQKIVGAINIPPQTPELDPFMVFSIPTDGLSNVGIDSNIVLVFSEAMNPLTVSTVTVNLHNDTAGTFEPLDEPEASSGDTTFSFTPKAPLAAGSDYTVNISYAVADVDNNRMGATAADDVSFSFSTQ